MIKIQLFKEQKPIREYLVCSPISIALENISNITIEQIKEENDGRRKDKKRKPVN